MIGLISKHKIIIGMINILLSTIASALVFPFNFSEKNIGMIDLQSIAISFYIYLFLITLINLSILTISVLVDHFLGNLQDRINPVAMIAIKLCIYSISGYIFTYFLLEETSAFRFIFCSTIITYSFMETVFSINFATFNKDKVFKELFYYGMIAFCSLIIISTLLMGFIA